MCFFKQALRKCQLVKDYTVTDRARNENSYHFSHLKGPFSSIKGGGRDEFWKKKKKNAWLPESIPDVQRMGHPGAPNTFNERQVLQNQRRWQAASHQRKLTSGGKRVPNCVPLSHNATRTKWRGKNPCLHTSLLIANEVGERLRIYFK